MDKADGQPLPAAHGSLALGVPPSTPGTIFALAITGGIAMKPRQGRTIVFGRNGPEVHVCVGGDDPQVSRQHGLLTHHRGQWRVSNTGRRPLRLPGSRMLSPDEEPVPLLEGYTPLFVQGSSGREHLLEHMIVSVRTRLSRDGVAGLTRDEVGEPVGNTLNHNLLIELVQSTTLVPPDLAILDEPAAP